MPVAFDATVLIDIFNNKLSPDRRAKIDELIQSLEKARTKIVIPTPALTEVLVRGGKDRETIFQELSGKGLFRVEPFDARAAMECALILDEAFAKDQKKSISKTKFKFDWQIVSICKTRDVTTIYSDDEDVRKAAHRAEIRVLKIDELTLPDSAKQGELEFQPKTDGASESK